MRSAQGENVWGHSSVLVGVKVSREAVHDKAEIRGSYAPAPAGAATCAHARHVRDRTRARTPSKVSEDPQCDVGLDQVCCVALLEERMVTVSLAYLPHGHTESLAKKRRPLKMHLCHFVIVT